MEIKEISSMNVFYKTFQTSLLEMSKYVLTTPTEMYNEAQKNDLKIIGPQVWIYQGMDGNPNTRFTLEIALPVIKPIKNNLQIKELPAFKCAAIIHKGDWGNLKNSYEKIISEIYNSGNSMSNFCREVYTIVESPDSENNITEIQIGIN
jgi:effector-binding domain-containing protein